MVNIVFAILWGLVGVACLVGLYWLVLWVFNWLGLPVPEKVGKVVLVIIVLLAIIWLATILFRGGPAFPFH
jgi:hypothetical protein